MYFIAVDPNCNQKVFLDNFPMLANSVASITALPEDYVGASFLYKCPASRGGSLRQHSLVVVKRTGPTYNR